MDFVYEEGEEYEEKYFIISTNKHVNRKKLDLVQLVHEDEGSLISVNKPYMSIEIIKNYSKEQTTDVRISVYVPENKVYQMDAKKWCEIFISERGTWRNLSWATKDEARGFCRDVSEEEIDYAITCCKEAGLKFYTN